MKITFKWLSSSGWNNNKNNCLSSRSWNLPNYHFMFFDRYCDPILQNVHVMFLDRYWSHITKWPFHVFWKRLSPYSRFSKYIRRIVGICRVFSCIFKMVPTFLRFPKILYYYKNDLGFSWTISSALVSPKIKNSCFWHAWTRPKIHKSCKWRF